IEGVNLADILKSGQLPVDRAEAIARQLADGLAAAHDAGVLHRDLKPQNILVDASDTVYISDFGLAKSLEPGASAVTRTGDFIGTPRYMSPEQVEGRPVDHRTDLYAFGLILYEMVTGAQPFVADTALQLMYERVRSRPKHPSLRNAQVPDYLAGIIMRCLEQDPNARYQSARQIVFDLDAKNVSSRVDGTVGDAQSSPAVSQQSQTVSATTVRSSRRYVVGSMLVMAAVLVAVVLGMQLWGLSSSENPSGSLKPERTLTYSLTVQKMRDNVPYQTPFEASGQEIFENGWKFRINASSPQSGFLYLLNEGPVGDGTVYTMLFPTPSTNEGSARIVSDERIQTGWYVFDQNQGTEKFWVIWANRAVPLLEQLKPLVNARDQGVITHPRQLNQLQELLADTSSAPSRVEQDNAHEHTLVHGSKEVLVHVMTLSHR
ncbi:MAG: serine/threonine-protein kinase, partial [Acidimicrobiia bacterium]